MADAAFVDGVGTISMAGVIEQQTLSAIDRLVAQNGAVGHWSSDFCRTASNRLALHIGAAAGQVLILVFDLAGIEVIAQHIVQRATPTGSRRRRTRGEQLGSGSDVAFFEVP